MDADILPVLLLLGRPASGKSEIIDYLQHLSADERRQRFRLGNLSVLDDFPLLWSWMEEDALLERMGKPRLHTTPDGYFSHRHSWDLLVQMLCLGYDKAAADAAENAAPRSIIIEFSRGTEHGGYRAALDVLSDSVRQSAAILYVHVSFEESRRKNRARFNPRRPHSILEHGLPDDKMERLYRRDDWEELPRAPHGSLLVRGAAIPAVMFENEDDATTPWRQSHSGEVLGARLETCLRQLRDARRA
jgi:hypothetical protein